MTQTQLRRKFRLVLNLYETTNENRLKTGGQLTAYLYAGGVQIEEVETIPIVSVNSGRVTITCSGRGALEVGDYVKVLRQAGYVDGSGDPVTYNGWTEQTGSFLIESIDEIDGAPGQFEFRIYNSSATTSYNTAIGDRFVIDRSVGGQLLSLYEDETDPTDTLSQPIDVPTNGVVEGYCDVRSMDVWLSGSIITDGWYAFNVPTGSGLLGPMTLQIQEIAQAIAPVINATTGVLKMTSGTGPTAIIEDATPGRLLMILPDVAMDILTSNGGADNTIYEATGRTINLAADEPFWLMGVEGASANIAYWVPVGTPTTLDLGLGELTDVSTAGAADGEVLGYSGGTWGPVDSIGTAAAPLQVLRVDDGALQIHNGASIYAQIVVGGLTSTRQYTFPDQSGAIVLTTGAANIFGNKIHQALGAGGGFQLTDTTSTRKAQFDLSGITASTTHVFAFPDNGGTFALVSQIPTELNDLTDVVITAASASDVLVHNGSTFVNTKDVGTAADPLDSVVVTGERSATGLQMVNSSGGKMQLADSELSAGNGWGAIGDYYALLPGRNGNILMDNTNLKHVTVNYPFNGTTDGLFALLAANNALVLLRFNQDTPWSFDTCWVVTKVWYQWVFESTAAVASPMTLSIYSNLGVPTTAAVPPSGTDELASASSPNIPVPSSVSHQVGVIDVWETAGNRNLGGVNFRHALYLGRSGGTNGPTTRGMLTITVEYIKSQGRVAGSTEVDTTVAL